MRTIKVTVCLLLLGAITSSCWNLKEPNQLAMVIGGGLDINQDGRLEVSSQIAIPAGFSSQETGPGKKRSYAVVSATGKDFMDAGQNLQAQLSRTLFYAHRQTILIGERMAEQGLADQGIGKYLDMIVRNPKSEIKSVIWIVKDGMAKDILKTEPLFDPLISTALSGVQLSLGIKPYYYREFLSDYLPHGGALLMPAVSIQPSGGKFNYSGAAILNKEKSLKLIGYLKPEESYYANWIKGRQRMVTVTAANDQINGSISLRVKPSRHIRVTKDSKGLRVHIVLHGTGTVVENNSPLNPATAKDLKTVQSSLSQEAGQEVSKLIQKAQQQYKADIFGIGELVHRKYPGDWKKLQDHWNDTFSTLPITSEVQLKYEDPGQTNSSM
ncbi:Ger(x)C family spore germination protein [Paenibacillus glycanilyticus]|uniref:Spore germination protein YndF n=1 Tax=Paenibacillus glycanilyticus TaxID=126569 RepID=A0ABQ6GI45_9BACL|nr:Ger(x)C family spore germination protein [Paenibacillus glycanilyticus]GLX70609.1 spore germination protein YndF [Paenibacillus glycanilyticus]